MTMQPPPSRYRVVEKGRRLVVIDTHTGQPAARRPAKASPESKPAALGPERIAFDGRSTLVTRAFYDDKAPRTLTLDDGATGMIEKLRSAAIGAAVFYAVLVVFFPWLLLLPIVLLHGEVRRRIRAATTEWLDRYDAGSSAG
ncbi:hypothetical protein [Sphingomonas sp.]|uniref:hypothetical protein n=1 Tax=Sphingomonas sp. TaxID=28214 RepID=UPI002DD6AA19|nr:hypothetical protein [Sphingomonas sp.]